MLQTAAGKAVTKCNVGDSENFSVTLSQLRLEAYIFFHCLTTQTFHKGIRVFFMIVWPELFCAVGIGVFSPSPHIPLVSR